jgi:hypothetical protein
MNLQIQQLAEQAHCYACEYAWQTFRDNPHNPYNQGMYKQRYDSKFAELIVKECAHIAVFKDSGTVATADVAGHMAAGRSIAARLIKEHFGVEE